MQQRFKHIIKNTIKCYSTTKNFRVDLRGHVSISFVNKFFLIKKKIVTIDIRFIFYLFLLYFNFIYFAFLIEQRMHGVKL